VTNANAPVIAFDEIETKSLAEPHLEPPRVVPATNASPTHWVSLQDWSARFGLSKPERVLKGNAVHYRVPTRAGVCLLTIGSRLAHFDGIAVWLGFPPQISRGQPHIHSVDAEKTLQPLVEAPATVAKIGRTIVLDPGHGGVDSGTHGAKNQFEKDYTLDWALRTERLLTNAGWRVFLTRRSDVDVRLAERIGVADRVNADLFVSLHFNSTFPDPRPSGIETYCLTPTGAPSTLSRGYADDSHSVFANNTFDAANTQFAYRIHRELLSSTHAVDNGIKRARFMSVLRYQSRPAVLVEGGFLSNVAEMDKIRSSKHRESLAQALAQALQ